MDLIAIVLIALVLIVVFFFLKQFGVLSGKGFIFAVAGVTLVFGWSVFHERRLLKKQEEFKKREKELEEEEKKLRELEKEYKISKEELFEAEAALKREKGKHIREIALIKAEKEDDLKAAKERINDSSISSLMENF
jgi:Skp family chaperone for outer membrane proteins